MKWAINKVLKVSKQLFETIWMYNESMSMNGRLLKQDFIGLEWEYIDFHLPN